MPLSEEEGMLRMILPTAAVSVTMTLLAVWSLGGAALPSKVKPENAHVRIQEVTYEPGVARERFIRPSNQVIVFLDDCRYERTDSTTKEKTVRERKSGDVIWHDKGEDAPQLINLGSKAYRTLLIEIK